MQRNTIQIKTGFQKVRLWKNGLRISSRWGYSFDCSTVKQNGEGETDSEVQMKTQMAVWVYFTENDGPFDKVPRERKGRMRDINYPYFLPKVHTFANSFSNSDESVKSSLFTFTHPSSLIQA